jgi:hypothetical protein
MISRRSFVQLSGASAIVSAAPAIGAPTARRVAEATALVRFAEQTHPRGLEARDDPRWRNLAKQLTGSVHRASAAGFVVRALALLAWFKDGHTTLWVSAITAGPFGLDMPIRVAPFYDGLYVTEATPEHRELLGTKISRVAATDIGDVIRRFAAIWPANNPAWPHHDAGLLFATPGLLHGLGIVSGPDRRPIAVRTQSANGRSLDHRLVPGVSGPREKLARTSSERDAWAAAAGSGNFVRRLPRSDTLYVSLDDISQPVDRFMTFTREIFAAMDEQRSARLVLDLRRNPGGNNFLGEPLRKHIERSRFNRPGGLYVLVSPTTFSAAQNLANRLERETFAIFAGEPTGGAPNHFGDAKPFPGTILHGGVSTIPWFDSFPMDHRQWIMPDMLIPRTFADWSAGRDAVLDRVLTDRRIGAADDATQDRTFQFARKSQSAAWTPFWMA